MSEAISVTFDGKIYSGEAVQKAAYRYMKAFVADISIRDDVVHCTLMPAATLSPTDVHSLVEDFKKEVLDQQLRAKLKAETESVRNLILGIAFSNTGLQSSE